VRRLPPASMTGKLPLKNRSKRTILNDVGPRLISSFKRSSLLVQAIKSRFEIPRLRGSWWRKLMEKLSPRVVAETRNSLMSWRPGKNPCLPRSCLYSATQQPLSDRGAGTPANWHCLTSACGWAARSTAAGRTKAGRTGQTTGCAAGCDGQWERVIARSASRSVSRHPSLARITIAPG
jgi:hypothetical protein